MPDGWWCHRVDTQVRFNAHSLEETLWRWLIRKAESSPCERQFWAYVEWLRNTLPPAMRELLHLHRWELVTNEALNVTYVDCHMDELNPHMFANEEEAVQYLVRVSFLLLLNKLISN